MDDSLLIINYYLIIGEKKLKDEALKKYKIKRKIAGRSS